MARLLPETHETNTPIHSSLHTDQKKSLTLKKMSLARNKTLVLPLGDTYIDYSIRGSMYLDYRIADPCTLIIV